MDGWVLFTFGCGGGAARPDRARFPTWWMLILMGRSGASAGMLAMSACCAFSMMGRRLPWGGRVGVYVW